LVELADRRAIDAINRADREADARLELERQFVWEGPRDVPLLAVQNTFDAKLRGFIGQRFRDSECFGDASNGNLGTTEVTIAENALMRVLSHAGWIELPSAPTTPAFFPLILPNCSANSIVVSVRSEAPLQTRRAARALSALLHDV